MSTDAQAVTRSSVRVTVVGPAGPADLVVPWWMTARELTDEYAAHVGAQRTARAGLVTASGHPLDAGQELQQLGVEHGDVLIVAEGAATSVSPARGPGGPAGAGESAGRAAPDGPRPDRPVVRTTTGATAGGAGGRAGRTPTGNAVRAVGAVGAVAPGLPGEGAGPDAPAGALDPTGETRRARRTGVTAGATLGMGAVCAVGSAAVVAVQGSTSQRLGCAALFVLATLATALPLRTSRIGGQLRAAASPLFAAAAGFTAGYSDGTGGLLLGLAVAALCGTGAAAVARAWLSQEEEELTDVALVVGATLSGLALVLLLLGSSVTSLLAIAYGVAVVAARLLPYLVVDVPDEALLDLDRLQNTAWSAREQPRGSRRKRVIVRPEGVEAVVRRGQRLMTSGTVVISAVVVVGGVLLVHDAEDDLVGISRVVMVLLGAAALALVARSVRARVPRTALRVSAGLVAAWTGLTLIDVGDPGTAWWIFAAAAAVGALTISVALALGQGWRSVWWARLADVCEALAIVLVVAAVPLASGIFGAVRSLVS